MRPLLLIALLTLAACGADGPPLRPGETAPSTGFSGQVKVGMVGG